MKPIAGNILLTIVALVAGAALARMYFVDQTPSIPAAMAPHNGAITEYWPNRKVRSERLYRDGQVQEAVYYSAEGSVVFEMSSEARD
ncbi:MAG: hypothetical protein WD669_03790 [Pirellulales bacterium]